MHTAILRLTPRTQQVQVSMLRQNQFPEPNRQQRLDFSSSYFTVQDHILSTIGDALTSYLTLFPSSKLTSFTQLGGTCSNWHPHLNFVIKKSLVFLLRITKDTIYPTIRLKWSSSHLHTKFRTFASKVSASLTSQNA